jgi:hypothetical protein
VKFALLQAVDVLAEFRDSRSRIQLTMIYDELDIEVRLAYHGERLSLPESPPPKDVRSRTREGKDYLQAF